MRFLSAGKRNLARVALVVIWVLAVDAITTAGGELVRITSPSDGDQVKGRVRVDARAQVDDTAYLIFCVDGARPHSTNVQPYFYDFDTTALPDGPHTLAVELYGRTGLVGQSAPVMVRVANNPLAEPLATVRQAPAAPAPANPTPVAAKPEPVTPSQPAAAAQPAVPLIVLGAPTPAAPMARGRAARSAEFSATSASPVLHVRPELAATARVGVALDGRELVFDVTPTMSDGRAFAALRTLMEQSGGRVNWLAAAKQAIAKRAGAELRVTIGAAQARLGDRAIELGATARLHGGRTVVPLRATCEPLGLKVAWSDQTRTVHVRSSDAPLRVGMIIAK